MGRVSTGSIVVLVACAAAMAGACGTRPLAAREGGRDQSEASQATRDANAAPDIGSADAATEPSIADAPREAAAADAATDRPSADTARDVPGSDCLDGACGDTCPAGASRCDGNRPQTCDGKSWVNGPIFCASHCYQGQCVGECLPGAQQPCAAAATCGTDSYRVCSATGAWGECLSACAPLLPGWEAVANAPDQESCPDGFNTPRNYLTSAKGDAVTCSCNCSGSQTCTGSVTLKDFGPATDCAGPPTSVRKLDVSPTCGGGGGEILMDHDYAISEVNYGPAPGCTSATTTVNKPDVIVQTTTLCVANDARNVAFSCVAHPGKTSCPDGFPTRTLMSSDYSDTRACSCACGSHLTCALSAVLLENDPVCEDDGPYVMMATSACSQAPTSYPLNTSRAIGVSTGDGTCAQIRTSTSGGVDLDDSSTITVCCRS
jgi:hypothetical protein